MSKKSVVLRDIISSALYVAPGQVIIPLANFIAAKRLNAPVVLLGVMVTGVYIGTIWNLFFSRITARFSLGNSIIVVMLGSSIFIVLAGFQSNAIAYCMLILVYYLLFGLYGVQYNTLIQHIYPPAKQQRSLSYRYMIISAVTVVLSLVFGAISVNNYTSVSLITGGLIVAAALVFRTIGAEAKNRMRPFKTRDILAALRSDRDLRLLAVALTIYGVVGAGLNAPLSLLYTKLGYAEDSVGLLSAIRVVGTVIAAAFMTPYLKQRGGVCNFRVPFCFAGFSVFCYLAVSLMTPSPGLIWILIGASFSFGFAVSSFAVMIQTTAIALAPEGKTSLYVNAMMILFGFRGLFWPILVGVMLRYLTLVPTLAVSAAATVLSTSITFSRAPGSRGPGSRGHVAADGD